MTQQLGLLPDRLQCLSAFCSTAWMWALGAKQSGATHRARRGLQGHEPGISFPRCTPAHGAAWPILLAHYLSGDREQSGEAFVVPRMHAFPMGGHWKVVECENRGNKKLWEWLWGARGWKGLKWRRSLSGGNHAVARSPTGGEDRGQLYVHGGAQWKWPGFLGRHWHIATKAMGVAESTREHGRWAKA